VQLLVPTEENQWEKLAHCINLKDEVYASFTHSLSSCEFSCGVHSIG